MYDQNIAFYAKQSFFNLKGPKFTKNGKRSLRYVSVRKLSAEYIFKENETIVWVGSFEIVMSIN